MKQKIQDIPIWESYENDKTECPICLIVDRMEKSFIDVLYDDMLMTPYFAEKLQAYSFCTNHYQKLYSYNNKLGLAILVNNFLQCEKDSLKKFDINADSKSASIFSKIISSKPILTSDEKDCYICNKIKENLSDYIEVLFELWNKNENFRTIYAKNNGHCVKHYNLLMQNADKKLNSTKSKEFKEITHKLQTENVDRLIDELDWFITKFDYRFKDEPWKNSRDALIRCIKKLDGSFFLETKDMITGDENE